MGEEPTVRDYWRSYLDSRKPELSAQGLEYEDWAFGNTPEMADDLGDLVKRGVKIATASLAWAYQADGEPYPEVGELSIILDGRGDPMCIIETTDIEIIAFIDVVEARGIVAWIIGERSIGLSLSRSVNPSAENPRRICP